MEFDNDSIDVSGVSDQRGSGRTSGGLGRGATIGGGGGLVALVITVLVIVLSGGELPSGALDTDQLTGGALADGSSGESAAELKARCSTEGAFDTYLDCRMVKVYNVVNTTWAKEFAARGGTYEQPGLVFFSGSVRTGCGTASSQVGPFYCPPDRRMYFDLDFLEQLQSEYGATGEFAQAYILAHEAGHHLQTLLGIEPAMRQQQQRNPKQANALSVGSSSRPTASPGCGPSSRTPTRARASCSPEPTSTRRSTPPQPWATTGSRPAPDNGSTPSAGRTGRRSSARPGSTPATTAETSTAATPSAPSGSQRGSPPGSMRGELPRCGGIRR